MRAEFEKEFGPPNMDRPVDRRELLTNIFLALDLGEYSVVRSDFQYLSIKTDIGVEYFVSFHTGADQPDCDRVVILRDGECMAKILVPRLTPNVECN
jgi:hypothetical protein